MFYFVASVLLLGLVAWNVVTWKQLQQEQASLAKRERDRKQQVEKLETLERLKKRQAQIASEFQAMRESLRSMHRVCRTVDDFFPVFEGQVVFSHASDWGSSKGFFWVPDEGPHRLRVLIQEEELDQDQGESPGLEMAKKKVLFNKTLTLKSRSKHGFIFQQSKDESSEDYGAFTLTIDGKVEAKIPAPAFDIASVGNEYGADHNSSKPQGRSLQIANVWFGNSGEGNVRKRICLNVTVESEGPERLAADDPSTVRQLINQIRLGQGEALYFDPRGWYTAEQSPLP
jgi:hypothetical protein